MLTPAKQQRDMTEAPRQFPLVNWYTCLFALGRTFRSMRMDSPELKPLVVDTEAFENDLTCILASGHVAGG